METAIAGLSHPWDVALDPAGTMITGERGGRVVARDADGRVHDVRADLGDLAVMGEGGLMSLVLDRDFAGNRTVFTCQTHRDGSTLDIRVRRWTAADDWSSMTRAGDVITGLPLNPSGRHSGCRLLQAPDSTLFVGAGDTAEPTVAQDPKVLGGKILHITTTGTPTADDFPGTPIQSLGHRNPQGLAFRPDTDQLWSTEHGPTFDDELNRLVPRANYGWDPNNGTSNYDESTPMTDTTRHPDAVLPVWTTGPTTLAISDMDFLGPQWGSWSGAVVTAALKGERLVLLRLSDDSMRTTARADVLVGQYGRLRSITRAPDGSLLITTDNGDDDKVLVVRPATTG
ncbi:PQQ-dependent sugar dehydrogenase [Williamsia sterculiae]|uniref:PQQ-dependent sugar dehydrogenase n=1 Tax=Williamsia sterculiae TaxID=1344003 RepID=UPI0013563D35|nr:PQQ-dependent sugar dehydrogenase [Williamsia sterculiae]